jgi:DNA-binding beta-propeller fold protein YncE
MTKLLAVYLVAAAIVAAVSWAARGSEAMPLGPRDVLPLQLEEQIPVKDVSGRIDHFSADVKRKRLFVSALGNNSLEVIDTFSAKVIHTIQDLSQPQGALYLAEFDKLYVANAGDGTVRVFDGSTYTLRKTIEFDTDPDNLRYDPTTKLVFVGFGEEDGGIATINPVTDERLGTVLKTGGHPESFQVEAKGTHVFVNVPDAGNVVESFERTAGSVRKWSLPGLKGNYAMALNEDDHRLYTVTRKVPMMVVLDSESGNEITRLPAAGECDDVYFDSIRKRIYAIGAQGFISVFQQNDPNHYTLVDNVPSRIGARTGLFYSRRDRLYVGVPAQGNEPAQVWTYEAED